MLEVIGQASDLLEALSRTVVEALEVQRPRLVVPRPRVGPRLVGIVEHRRASYRQACEATVRASGICDAAPISLHVEGADGRSVAELDGRPIIDHALEALEHRWLARRVVIVGAYAAELGAALTGHEDLDVRRCSRWAEGPARSLRTGLEALTGLEWALVVLGDEARLPSAAVDRLLRAVRGAPRASAARATWSGRPGHPVLLHSSRWEEVSRLRAHAGARALLDRRDALHVECGDLGAPVDIDSPEDLRRAAGTPM